MACKTIVGFLGALLIAQIILMSGCSSFPSPHIQQLADRNRLETRRMSAGVFELTLYLRQNSDNSSSLHIYLEGDGSPWIRHRYVSRDPTTRDPVALKLMLSDPANVLYLSRPCYQGTSQTPPCNPRLWTSERYSPLILDSMSTALGMIISRNPGKKITLIGYSGGGTLALLLANRLSEVDTVVTIAANLDTKAWTDYHGYLALEGSVNPASITSWRPSLRQIHLKGLKDQNIPPHLSVDFAKHSSQAQWITFNEFDHHCCWVRQWPQILDRLNLD